MSDQACEVPLIEQLRSVPRDYRAGVEVSPTEWRNIPYGRMMNEAADALERLQRERDAFRLACNGEDAAFIDCALKMQERAEKAEAELARLTPTEDEKWEAQRCLASLDGSLLPIDGVAAALLRKFVLQTND